MKSSRQGYLAASATWFLLLAVFANPSSAETLVMPRDLVDFALANRCTQIDEFFERPGTVKPPYAYGSLPDDPEAVFWCKKVEPSEMPYNLMFKVSDPRQLAGCPAVIEWRNPPRGLSIETRRNLALRDFRYLTSPQRLGSTIVVPNARVIVNDYDGVTNILYCHGGQWLVASFE